MKEFENLRKLIADTKVDSNTYVYYDQESGKIKKIGGKSKNTDLSYIITDSKIVEPIMKGLKGLDDYVVEYDISKKKLNLKEIKKPETEDARSLLTFKAVPKQQKTRKIDVLIQQDLKNKCWKIKLSKAIVESLINESIYIRSNLFFSITKKNDPNVLYRTISCPIGELVKEENLEGKSFLFKYDTEYQKDISVYTSNYFDVYKYEVLE